ncbi:cyclic nucleotide-gated cation channel beta-3-like [Anneissia japonica]|uniref:cyclic nucleotide-gated cation channel beta-3-like n=1 Tax=Anneissia japonica TaxID=1529436 RepID=UPI0014258082|nr:cyclic nucleotide-gated cation channel beta-3-like [Anneissia japonica]
MSQLPLLNAWAGKHSSISSINSSEGSFSLDCEESQKTERFRQIFKTVVNKANKMRQNKVHPEALEVPLSKKRKRLDSFAPSSCVEETVLEVSFFSKKITVPKWLKRLKNMKSIDPSGSFWLTWLFVVSMAFVYNAITIFLRGVFGHDNDAIDQKKSSNLWLAFDLIFDFIYLLDILFRTRLQFIHGGMYVEDKKLTRTNYFKSRNFKLDLVCLLPFDLFSKAFTDKRYVVFIRLPRLLKYHCYNEFVSRFENSSSFADAFRVGKMVSYLLYMIHLNTCCYYAVSLYEGLSSNEWVYNVDTNANPYIRCMFRATKTLITIGNLPEPVTDLEIVFMNIDFAIGIFVFASIIGQMRDIVGAASATKERFRQRMDNTMLLLHNWKIPEHVQKKVRMWYMYKWDNGELIDEADILSGVPFKMQTDIAIHVHMDTLTKVSLFQDCDKMLLRDLMLKLRPVLFLPGNFICRKGEVGKEMYIIKSGQVQVLGGGKVLATLHAGSVFGEISLLSLSGGNRRTADVYSPGYASLFVLDKETLHETLVNYPEAQELLQNKAKEILRKNEENGVGSKKKKRGKSLIAESILMDKENNPRFFNAVLQVARENKLASTVLKGSMSSNVSDQEDDWELGDEEAQDHKDSVVQDGTIRTISGGMPKCEEPNVVVHQPPTGIACAEELGSHTGDHTEDKRHTVEQSIGCKAPSSVQDQMQQSENDKKEEDSPPIEKEQSKKSKETNRENFQSVEFEKSYKGKEIEKPISTTPVKKVQSIVSEETEKDVFPSLAEQIIGTKKLMKSDSTGTQIENESAGTQVKSKSSSECTQVVTQIEGNSAAIQSERDSDASDCIPLRKNSTHIEIEASLPEQVVAANGFEKSDPTCTGIENESACSQTEHESIYFAQNQSRPNSECTQIETEIESNSTSTLTEREPAATDCKPLRKSSTHIEIDVSKDFLMTEGKENDDVEDNIKENMTGNYFSIGDYTASPDTKCYRVIETELENQTSGMTECIEADQR